MVFPIFAALSLGLGALGLAAQVAGTVVQAQGFAQQADASRRAEALRERQMNLESSRQRRQTIRNAIRARSLALTAATAQGASSGSGLPGGYGQIGGATARNIQGVNQAQEISSGIFRANSDMAGAQELTSFGGGLSSLGGALFSASPTIGKLTQFGSGQAQG